MPDTYPDDIQPNLTNADIIRKKLIFYAAGMEAIAEHSMVDAKVSYTLTQMLGANPKPAVAMYETLSGARAEARALKAVGKETLSALDYDLLIKIMNACNISSDFRDSLAHRIWMSDDHYPDAVILFEPKSLWRTSVKITSLNAAGPVSVDGAVDVQRDIRKASQIWRLHYLDTAKRAASTAFIALTAFNEALALGTSFEGVSKREQIHGFLRI